MPKKITREIQRSESKNNNRFDMTCEFPQTHSL